MINHVLPRMACVGAMLLFALAHCGCQSMSGSSWATAWKSKPASPANPNDKETVRYMGQKKPQKTQISQKDLEEKMDRAGESDRSRLFAEQLRIGNQGLRDNRLDDAKRAYERALNVKPNDPDCHHGLAVVADNQKQFEIADQHYEAALKVKPRDANLLSDYGYSQYLRGSDDRAERILKEALTVSPSHKGAMASLGAIYAKQGRQEDALAMFRRGATQAETEQYMSQLFPQAPAGVGGQDTMIAQVAGQGTPRTAPPMPTDDRVGMKKPQTPEELSDAMRRARVESIQRRNDQQMADLQPPRREIDDRSPSGQRPGNTQGNQPWVLGGNSSPPNATAQNQNQMPVVTPGGSQPQQFAANNQGYAPNQGAGQNSNGQLMAQPGSNPNIEFWQGAPVQSNQNIQQAGGNAPQNTAMAQGNGQNGWAGNPQPWAGDTSQNHSQGSMTANANPEMNNQGGSSSASSASEAAAQFAMNLGPGSLFPVVSSDGVAQAGFSTSNGASFENRAGWEFSQPPQYQTPQSQNTIAPPSTNGDWGNFKSNSVSQAGGPEFNGGANYRGANPGGPDANRSANSLPYSGPWPSNGSSSKTGSPSSFNSRGAGSSSSSSNPLPNWGKNFNNSGSSATSGSGSSSNENPLPNWGKNFSSGGSSQPIGGSAPAGDNSLPNWGRNFNSGSSSTDNGASNGSSGSSVRAPSSGQTGNASAPEQWPYARGQ